MHNITVWSINIVAVSVISAVLRMMLPKGKIGGGVLLGINLMVLLVVISPFGSGEEIIPSFDFSAVEMVDFQVEEYTNTLTEEILREDIKTKLDEIGINSDIVIIDISMKDLQEENLSVLLTLPEEYEDRKGEVEREIEDYLQIPVMVMSMSPTHNEQVGAKLKEE